MLITCWDGKQIELYTETIVRSWKHDIAIFLGGFIKHLQYYHAFLLLLLKNFKSDFTLLGFFFSCWEYSLPILYILFIQMILLNFIILIGWPLLQEANRYLDLVEHEGFS